MTAARPRLSAPAPGFTDPVFDAQRTFRALMDAMARPGLCLPLAGVRTAPRPLTPVAAAVALTLFDGDTPVWLDKPFDGAEAARRWLAFHTGAPIARHMSEAAYVLVADPAHMPALSAIPAGSDEYPDRAATLILQVHLLSRTGPLLHGPGIAETAQLGFDPMPASFWQEVQRNRASFPRGVDLILAAPNTLAALPRSVFAEVS